VYDRRAEASNKLESAENALLKMAAKIRAKKLKKEAKAAKKSGASPSTGDTPAIDAEGRPLTHVSVDDPENNVSLAEKLVPQKKRPTHRLPLSFMPFALPFIGEKVDSINWARDQIVATNDLLAKGRALIDSRSETLPPHSSDAESTGSNDVNESDKKSAKKAEKGAAPSQEYAPLNSAFITFNQQIAAHMAKNALNHHDPYRMTGRYAEVAPEDVIWANLGLNAYEAKVRMLISYAATAGLIILWALPGEPPIVPSHMKHKTY
jgi:calcium permeable stress-gated cation channel